MIDFGHVAQVRYIGPTDCRGSRWAVAALPLSRRHYIPRDHALEHVEDAARAVAEAFEAEGLRVAVERVGYLPDSTYAFFVRVLD